jgi:transglutaminase-like putative cysteine protease
MELAVEHDTTYTYATPARYSMQYLRLRPHQSPRQTVRHWSVKGPEALSQFRDGFGNDVEVLSVTKPHQSFTVAVRGRVSTFDDGASPDDDESLPPPVFLRSTQLTAADAAILDLAQRGAKGARLEAVESLIERISAAVSYCTGATLPATTAAEVLAGGGGVCQDFSHLLIACCRSRGVPARYVSGYYWADPRGSEYQANHAWTEVFVAERGWIGFDAANHKRVDDAYVRLASGLDYLDAAPVRGMRRGGGSESLTVRVRVAQAQAGQQ